MKKSVKKSGGVAPEREALGKFLESLGDRTSVEAESLIKDAIGKYPLAAGELYFRLGEIQFHAGQHEAAADSYSRATELNPGNIAGLGRLGATFSQLGRGQEAAACFLQIIQRSASPPPWAKIGLGNELEKLGQFDEAIVQFRSALSLTPESRELRDRLVALYRKLQRTNECIDLLEQQADEQADHEKRIETLLETGELALSALKPQVAESCFKKVLALKPAHAGAIAGLSNAKTLARQSYEEARKVVTDLVTASKLQPALLQAEALLAQYDREPGAYHLCAELYTMANQTERAVELYKKLLTIVPTDLIAHGQLASYMLETGDCDSAIAHFQAAGDASPKPLPWVHIGLGNAFERKGDLAACISSFERALELDDKRRAARDVERFERELRLAAEVEAAGGEERDEDARQRGARESVRRPH